MGRIGKPEKEWGWRKVMTQVMAYKENGWWKMMLNETCPKISKLSRQWSMAEK